ncbi:MAG: carbohydrate ABC transporter substrate-binding protein [Deltaproteobacteria bacterium]|nr:carbohydrate ABC transporter substrate-binding protein [Deltaproteobacteria bacterium]
MISTIHSCFSSLVALILLFCLSFPATAGFHSAQPMTVLTLGSWRTDDIPEMNVILGRFHEAHPDIRVVFDPTPAPDYDQVLTAQLEGGTAPDLFYLRSFTKSRQLHEAGHLEKLNDLPGLAWAFATESLAPWTGDDGVVYGVPFIATSHAVYYNADLFSKFGLSVPRTWEELLAAAETLKKHGITPFANACGDAWTINEIVFFNILPNFIGGRAGRLEYLAGRRCFNDESMVRAFEALHDLSRFFPDNHDFLRYSDSLQLFVQGKAAMWMGGSWDIPYFEQEKPAFSWRVFAPPPPAGYPGHITFHLDAGIGLNSASTRKEAARVFLTWLTNPATGELLGNTLPGFFPMHRTVPELDHAAAREFLSLNQGRGTDVRFVWDRLRDGNPDAYPLLMDLTKAVIRGDMSPRNAADALQQGLALWYEPARGCGREPGP